MGRDEPKIERTKQNEERRINVHASNSGGGSSSTGRSRERDRRAAASQSALLYVTNACGIVCIIVAFFLILILVVSAVATRLVINNNNMEDEDSGGLRRQIRHRHRSRHLRMGSGRIWIQAEEEEMNDARLDLGLDFDLRSPFDWLVGEPNDSENNQKIGLHDRLMT